MTNKMIKGLSVALALAAAAFASPALAEPIMLGASDVGESFTIEYDGFADGQTIDGLSALTVFTLTAVNGTTYEFDYSVTNTSSGGVSSRISSFAFNTDPDISSAVSTGVFDTALTGSSYPNGIGSIDVCFKAAFSGSCAGNRDGLLNGETGTGSLSLNFLTAPTSLTLDDFFVRYQSITGAGNVSSASGQQTSTSSGGTPVPAPGGMLALLAMALFGFGLARRRPRSAPIVQGRPAFA